MKNKTYPILTPEMEKLLCEEYLNTNLKQIEIIKKFNISIYTFPKILKKHNILKRKPLQRNKIFCNENYFEIIDTKEKAFWLGFIAADACVRKRKFGYEFILKLKMTDCSILETLIKDLNSEHKIRFGNYLNTNYDKYHRCCVLEISRKKLCEDLEKYGFGRNKSKLMKLPKLSDNLMRHFIRGYFCGNGSVGVYNGQLTVNFASPCNDFLLELRNYLIVKCNASGGTLNIQKNYSTVTWGGNLIARKITDYLSQDGGLWLNRKRNIIINHCMMYDVKLAHEKCYKK